MEDLSDLHESVFDLAQGLESINGGACRFDVQQMFPITGAISDTIIGNGATASNTVFQWKDSTSWWSPQQSYYYMQLQFLEVNGATPAILATPGDAIAYCDNFVTTLFTQITTQIDGRPLDTIILPAITDTALTYAGAKNNFLKSFGSLTRVGESLTTRIANLKNNGGYVEVCFRPPVSLYDAKLLPPGAEFKTTFTWAPNGLNAFECPVSSLVWTTIGKGATGTQGNVQLRVTNFSFYKATIMPGPNVMLPDRGVVDLMPAQINQYFITGGNTLRQNITLPSTTNRILVTFQDYYQSVINSNLPYQTVYNPSASPTPLLPPVDNVSGVGNGYYPATSFTNSFLNNNATGTADTVLNQIYLQQLWLSLPELGYTVPQPVYNFNFAPLSSGTGYPQNDQDYTRAYSDFCLGTQGISACQDTGSIPFGNFNPGVGTSIIYIDSTLASSVITVGDPNNPQQYPYLGTGALAPPTSIYDQTAKWGWSGRNPGPIFCFPIVRPPGKTITSGTLNITLAGNGSMAKNCAVNVIASYNMAIVVEKVSNEYYKYSLVEGE